ncbi:MAG TPA: hypothetical protein VFE55_09470 [Acidimicrobiia bacterium]|nr:hypothetical protein [Acidimicrobiia bacterium]
MSAILRHRHPNRFTILPNDAIRNQALSFRAVGVLAHLLSLPDGAKVDSTTLAAAHKEGRDAVRGAFKELEVHGYYRRDIVRLPDGTLRTEVVVSNTPMEAAEGNGAGRAEDGSSGSGPTPEDPAPVDPAPVDPTSVEPAPVDQAPKDQVPTTEALFPPHPPRRAGGHEVSGAGAEPEPSPAGPPGGAERLPRAPSVARDGEQRTAGRRSRALGTNPRAEADRAEQAHREARADARRAEVERATQERRSAERAAAVESERLEAEARAVSAALDDASLAAVVAAVRPAMSGPLAVSGMAVARAVVGWCRCAVTSHGGDLAAAVAAGLAAGSTTVGEGTAPPLALPVAPPGTAPLRSRIAALLKPVGEV